MDDIERQGIIGEKLASNYITAFERAEVLYSVDPYDRIKDFTANGKTVEIKTEIPFVTQKSITFDADQKDKLMSVDRAIFVIVPYGCKLDGKILEIDMHKVKMTPYYNKTQNKDKYKMSWSDPAIKILHTVTQEEQDLLTKYNSKSKWQYEAKTY